MGEAEPLVARMLEALKGARPFFERNPTPASTGVLVGLTEQMDEAM